ncbi:uncharacterized protein BT62DRAFT_929682 [Guyanagaster necrorhizus]|uniref:RING-type domain-containing protein n=1 Tax=Guyanagaster necrorhizus TaxID=856835 RepID=A0A9P8AUT7_9AGAR|nr:uncharacterized protein BT62DRAFT_929682 [Guyanagaster necrorhizus MCA 3950]KAG7448595.1 hypothetical protein BT62DRAFT_929682 [Guyanagaster necrorhizus MCA 3950]
MSRVADAARIAPYLTHAVSHHGQVTLIPPDNAGRVRKTKAKKGPRRAERRRDEEEIRFNVGPRHGHTKPSTGRNATRQPRHRDDDEMSIPDYPPPSFLEAISTPPLSVCPSTTTLVTAPRQTNCTSNSPPSPTSLHSDADSDESIEIIEMASVIGAAENQVNKRFHKRWAPSSTHSDPVHNRGRRLGIERAILDSDSDDAEPSPPPPSRSRHLSLSPFRLLSPKTPATQSDQSNTPYRLSSPFLRSTTSLRATMSSSSLRLPLSPSSSPRGDSPLGRKLFSKGKERSRSCETLDSWEVLESELEPPTSLLSAVEAVSSPDASPTQDHPFPSPSSSFPPRTRRSPPPPPPPRHGVTRPPPPPPGAAQPHILSQPSSPLASPINSLEANTAITTERSKISLPPPGPPPFPSDVEAPGPSTSTSQYGPSLPANAESPVRSTRPYMHPLSTASFPVSPQSSPSSAGPSPASSETPTRHHYLGRPLPPRPGQVTTQNIPTNPVFCAEDLLIDFDEHTPVVTPAASSSARELTDFDLLMASLERDDVADGSNYDTLLLVSEIMGPASATLTPSSPPLPTPKLGRVSVERRRVMKDGRVKLKLVLLERKVDRCGVCLAQFKEADRGALSSSCGHAFHEVCLRKWLMRSRTCPMCRETLGGM